MFGTVQEMNPSKSGKSMKLKINGKWLTAGGRVNLDGVSAGGYVEYEEGSFPGSDGTMIACINRIRPAQAGAAIAQQGSSQPPCGVINGGAPQSAAVDEASLRFISNVVGSAIAAKTIENPTDVRAWTLAAREALQALSEPVKAAVDPEFNDDMPDNFYENLPPQKAPQGPSW